MLPLEISPLGRVCHLPVENEAPQKGKCLRDIISQVFSKEARDNKSTCTTEDVEGSDCSGVESQDEENRVFTAHGGQVPLGRRQVNLPGFCESICVAPLWKPPPAARQRFSFEVRMRPQGCSRNPNIRRYQREIALGKQDSTGGTGQRVHLWMTSKATRVWLPHGNTNLGKWTDF